MFPIFARWIDRKGMLWLLSECLRQLGLEPNFSERNQVINQKNAHLRAAAPLRNLCLASALIFSGNAWAQDVKFREIETKYIFGFTTGSDIGLEGEKEIAVSSEAMFKRRGGTFQAFKNKLEFEYTPTQFISLEFGILNTVHGVRNVPGLDDHNQTHFGGLSGELKYLLIGRGPASPFGLAVSIEPEWGRVGSKGGRENSFAMETKLMGDVELMPNRLYGALNVIYEPELVKERGVHGFGRESSLGVSTGLSYRFTPTITAGGEIGVYNAYEGLYLNKLVGQAVYVGPTLHVQLTKKMFVQAAFGTQIAGHANDEPGHLDLTNFSRHRAKLKLALEF
jgi:hypothetical protein